MKSTLHHLIRCLLPAVCLLTAGAIHAASPDAAAFWSFDNWKSGDGVFTTTVTAETFQGTPTLTYAGSSLSTSGGASTFTDYTGAIWLGSGGSGTPGHSIGWNAGSTGNSFSVALDTTGFGDLQVGMSIRSFTGGLTGFASLEYSLDGGGAFVSSGLSQTFTSGSGYAASSYVLSSLTAIDNQASVILRWSLADIPSGTSVRIDNLQITASAIPEPSTTAAIAGGAAILVLGLRRRRDVKEVV
jgi:hypothetical protein